MRKSHLYALILGCLTAIQLPVMAQNPLIMNQFTADPSARVFEGKLYIYPSHDILASPGHGKVGWFCMEDYHVFSSENLTDWTDHGMILSQSKVEWADSTAYSMWAPDCAFKNGKYYFYFPTMPKDKSDSSHFKIGVAVSNKPYGPFIPEMKPIAGVQGIDPNIFIDKGGQSYMYWAEGNIYAAKLTNSMLELATKPQVLTNFPEKGLKEGPFMFERKGIYFLTYPHVANKTERLEYATSDNPLGPFKFSGVIMDESSSGCWTNHQSIVEYKGQWYLFYHDDDLSPNFDKSRSIRADSLFFNADGSIRKVIPTRRGVGLTQAATKIQIDRYSDVSEQGTTLAYLDTLDRMKGWKLALKQKDAWVRYNAVDFGTGKLKGLNLKAASEQGSKIEIRLDSVDGVLIADVNFPRRSHWNITEFRLPKVPSGKHDLFVISKSLSPVEIDWLQFH